MYHVADDILDLLNHKNIKKAVIGGWSRGGYIASSFYDSYPERVIGLILEDGGSVAANAYFHTLEDERLFSLVNDLFGDRIEYKKFESQFEVYNEYQDREDPNLQFELLAWIAQDNDGLWTIGPGIEELFHMKNPDQFITNIKKPTLSTLFARSMVMMDPLLIFRNLNVPVLILDPICEGDLFPFEKENERLKKLHPDLITHKIYYETGHNIHYEKPKEFLEDVVIFLNSLK